MKLNVKFQGIGTRPHTDITVVSTDDYSTWKGARTL
jgi:hypothetical protein